MERDDVRACERGCLGADSPGPTDHPSQESSWSPPWEAVQQFTLRNDAESINRALDDTLWLRRAHSLGHRRQHLNLLGYALMVNSLTLHRHRRHRPGDLAVAA